MALKRMDNIGIVVEDLGGAIDFFRELGLELEGRAMIEGEWAGRVTGLGDQHVEIAMMRTPDGHSRLELSRFLTPDVIADHRNAPVNALGYLRAMFTVDDIDDTLERLRARGARRAARRRSRAVSRCVSSLLHPRTRRTSHRTRRRTQVSAIRRRMAKAAYPSFHRDPPTPRRPVWVQCAAEISRSAERTFGCGRPIGCRAPAKGIVTEGRDGKAGSGSDGTARVEPGRR